MYVCVFHVSRRAYPCGLLLQYVKEHRQSIVDDAKVRRIKHKKPLRRGYA